MSKTLSITVYPSALGAEYLSVSDAMRQILDIVEALERTEDTESSARKIVWRLKDAHTNSPPFTVTAEAYSINPTSSVGFMASRVTSIFATGLKSLLDGDERSSIATDIAIPIARVFDRNQNGVGRTEIRVGDDEEINVLPANAKVGSTTLERIKLSNEVTVPDYRRTEFGAVEAVVCGLTRWNDHPALVVIERLSRDKVTCVLSTELAEKLGPSHQWSDVWEGRRLLVTGALNYAQDGALKRIDAEDADDMPWADVSLDDLVGISLTDGRSVTEHLTLIRGLDRG